MDRLTIIRDGLAECERMARAEGWHGPWEQQPADMEWIADRLRSAGLALPDADGTHAYTAGELDEIGVADAFRARWLAPSSAAAAALGKLGAAKGGKAGTGAAKVRGDADHYRAIRAKRPAPQVYERRGEWGGYTVREALKGWIVEWDSREQGAITGARVLVPYGPTCPRGMRLDSDANPYLTNANRLAGLAADVRRDGFGGRILRRGHIVR